MLRCALFVFCLVILIAQTFASTVATKLSVVGKVFDTAGFAMGQVSVVLDSGDFRTVSRADGSFTFHNVPSGIYALDVYSTQYHFPSMKIMVVSENASVSVVEYKFPGAKRLPADYPIAITALTPIQFRIPRPAFNLLGMLMANPMILMMLFSLLMVIGMPMLMKNLTPEELEEMQKNSLAAGDPMQKLTQLMGGAPKKAIDDDDE